MMCADRNHMRHQLTLSDAWRQRLLPLFVSALTLAPGYVGAQSCSVSSPGVSFGTYHPLLANNTTPLDAASTISYLCNQRIWVVITLSTGQSGVFANRLMGRSGSATDKLQYNLYLDAARTAIWGDLSLGAGHYYIGRSRRNQTISVSLYGRVPENQDAVPGLYSDLVVVTIEY